MDTTKKIMTKEEAQEELRLALAELAKNSVYQKRLVDRVDMLDRYLAKLEEKEEEEEEVEEDDNIEAN